MKPTVFIFCALLLMSDLLFAQHQKPQAPPHQPSLHTGVSPIQLKRQDAPKIQADNQQPTVHYENFAGSLTFSGRDDQSPKLKITKDKTNGLPIAISGQPQGWSPTMGVSNQEKSKTYLEAIKEQLQIENPDAEFDLRKQRTDEQGISHLRWQQVYQGIPVFGAEVIVHLKDDGEVFFNGRYFPTPELNKLTPELEAIAAIDVVKQDVVHYSTLKELTPLDLRLLPEGQQFTSQLVIYHPNGKINAEKLVWQITIFPNITDRWEYFIDAQNGAILHRLQSSCRLFHDHGKFCGDEIHKEEESLATDVEAAKNSEEKNNQILGKETANATDLNNQSRLIHTYSVGSTYYLIDASRNMHDAGNAAISDFPDGPAGVVWTLDAFDTSPQNSNFNYDHVKSNNNSWNDRNSVSAHYNGGEAYLYFEQVHFRNSINGKGGNIISLINVADDNGQDMDNAFWNGAAMFYGSGRQAFNAPLAKALDVAGHEMSHGVIQATANLTYENQSGALNESFADIFGAMIDRDDWKIGEEVSNPSVFPSGTMRDMQNPHNGGNSNDFYWQPDHMDEFVNLPNTQNGDFGGVHINSGIVNHAYYLFATAVGKDKAEKVYFKALEDFLVASSQFVDLRIAVLQAAEILYGQTEVNAAANAFNQVGIVGDQGGDYETDVNENPGDDLVLFADLNRMDIFYPNNPGNPDLLTATGQSSRPSVSDDGSFVVFVDDQSRLKGIQIDWSTGDVQEFELENPAQTIWRNIAVSKDGNKVAFLYELIGTDRDREIIVYDFVSNTSKTFELYNPTTSNGGEETGDVQFADVMEFDITGQYILYDAFNELSGLNGEDISYWDIGTIRVWNNAANGFDNGVVSKIFSGLQENESVGNPTFSKNSPYIIAFDYFAVDQFGQETYILYGANIEQNEIDIIDDQIFKLSYPSFAPSDKQILYSDLNNGQDIIIQQDLSGDKISGVGNWVGLVGDATWAVWFANGFRDLVGVNDFGEQMNLQIFPNPFYDQLTLQFQAEQSGDGVVEVYDVLGKTVCRVNLEVFSGENKVVIPDVGLGAGIYNVSLKTGAGIVTLPVVKGK